MQESICRSALSFYREHVSLFLKGQWELPCYLGDGSANDSDRRGDVKRASRGGQHDDAHGGDEFSV